MKQDIEKNRKKVFEEIINFLEISMFKLDNLVIDNNEIRFVKNENSRTFTYDIVNTTNNFFAITIKEIIPDTNRKNNLSIYPILVEGFIPLNRLSKTFQNYFEKY